MEQNQKISNAGARFIYSHEAFVGTPYRDTAGNWTIGIGHLIDAWESHLMNQTLSFTQAWTLFESDLNEFEGYVRHYIDVDLTQSQFDALVSLVYNIGPGNFSNGSNSLDELINRGASEEVIRAKWLSFNDDSNGNIQPGLVARRKDEFEMYSKGLKPLWVWVGIGTVSIGVLLVVAYKVWKNWKR